MPYYIYILANLTGTLYVAVTSNLEGRMLQRKSHAATEIPRTFLTLN